MSDTDAPTTPAALSPERRQALMDVIFRTFGHSRFTQDSPLRPDVWVAYWEKLAAGEKDPRVDLILTPAEGSSPGRAAVALEAMLADADGPLKQTEGERVKMRETCRIAYSRTAVQAALTPEQALTAVVALSVWWEDRTREARETDEARGREENLPCGARALKRVEEFLGTSEAETWTVDETIAAQAGSFQFYRFAALASLTLMFGDDPRKAEDIAKQLRSGNVPLAILLAELKPYLQTALTRIDDEKARLANFENNNPEISETGKWPRIWNAAVNRAAGNAVYVSRRTIKVDATQTLFRVNTTGIVWAVIDSGIDARHPAFFQRQTSTPAKEGWPGRTRINRSFDLTFLRDLLTCSDFPKDPPELSGQGGTSNAAQIKSSWDAFVKHKKKTQSPMIDRLRDRRNAGLPIGWEILAPLVEIPHDDALYRPPRHDHGTHVAGILAAGWDCPRFADNDEPGMMGACPDLRLIDIRAFDAQGVGREDTVIEAIDLIRYLNRESNRLVIHGANLSLSVTHDVQAFGCGQTPVCIACNELVRNGVVVVAAAGNSGHEGDAALGSRGQSTRDISITDPGNADLVITVGSTHRQSPFSYGVSYFSSRGPTADGRLKPDLVAPGEKICGPIPLAGDGTATYKILDGTSMAAPHVSGVAALLMARNRELIGEPLRIKEILCRTATDLGRMPTFQGAGLVDALRALQSV
ncbi:S8 family peptidase [Paracoccus sp. SSK6]|uniref:S8 family peptidase n=1 Tax=Paracoccus sp. SSK6 TaxID=3143131 RepID=UPI00321AD50D